MRVRRPVSLLNEAGDVLATMVCELEEGRTVLSNGHAGFEGHNPGDIRFRKFLKPARIVSFRVANGPHGKFSRGPTDVAAGDLVTFDAGAMMYEIESAGPAEFTFNAEPAVAAWTMAEASASCAMRLVLATIDGAGTSETEEVRTMLFEIERMVRRIGKLLGGMRR